jgi:glycosyltransferase involved in cell wall biosynthesis
MFVSTTLALGGGAEAALTRLVTAEPQLAHNITVVSLLPGDEHVARMRRSGITVVELRFDRPGSIIAGLFKVATLIRQIKPEIIQGWMYHGDLVALLALTLSGRRRKTRLIWSIRCSNFVLRNYGVGLWAVIRACALLSRAPEIVIANSVAGRNDHLALGYRPRRSEIIYNGIDTDEFRPDPAARLGVRQEFGFPPNTVVVAHVARVDPMKDHQLFLAAMRDLPDLQALLIGRGTDMLADAPNLHRLGRRADVARLMAAADIIVSSSCYGEGFSNSLAEGMACGLPPIATAVGDAAYIVGETGIIVPPRDANALTTALRHLADESAAERAKRGTAARNRIIENFAMKYAIQRHAALYASLLRPDDCGGGTTEIVNTASC